MTLKDMKSLHYSHPSMMFFNAGFLYRRKQCFVFHKSKSFGFRRT